MKITNWICSFKLKLKLLINLSYFRELPLVKVTVPHAPKTLAKFIYQLRSEVRNLNEDDKEIFFSMYNARPDLCTKSRGKFHN